MLPKIIYISRKRLPQYHSIEELFLSIQRKLATECISSWIELNYGGTSLKSIFKNFGQIHKKKDSIYHITGHVNYIGIRFGRRSILTVHDIGSALKGNFIKRKAIKYFWFVWPTKKVKWITVISEFTKKELIALVPSVEQKIRVIYNPVSDEFKPTPYTFNTFCPTILFVGTKPNKNLEKCIQSISLINCKIHIIGPLSNNQLMLLKKYNISFINQQNLSRKEVVKAYRSCDFVCFPSTYEGFGMPILEAQATGRPVITSNFGAMKEVAAESACLVDPYQVSAIKEAINKIINDEQYRNTLIKKGYKNIKRFSLDYISKQYLDLYKQF
jgi:glycosyltransferase involved in cell wall biosynthesis